SGSGTFVSRPFPPMRALCTHGFQMIKERLLRPASRPALAAPVKAAMADAAQGQRRFGGTPPGACWPAAGVRWAREASLPRNGGGRARTRAGPDASRQGVSFAAPWGAAASARAAVLQIERLGTATPETAQSARRR